MALVPSDQRAPRPQAGCLPDHRMGEAVGQRVGPAGRARLEHRTGRVPLEEMDHPARAPGEVGELVNEETLAGAGKPGEEHHPLAAQAAEPLLEPGIGVDHETAANARSLARFTLHVPRRRRPGDRARLKPLEPAWRSAALRPEGLAPSLVVLLELAVRVDD